jgi:ATP-dependent helicase/nuclease subunit A
VASDPRATTGDAPLQAAGGPAALRDLAARRDAVDPTKNIVLEASAGTGKTRVLVDRYVNLLRAGVDPRNILAMTFTRKAAAEMRERILRTLREAAEHSPDDEARWRQLRDRLNDIAISTIDAFCLSLLREFPLEADLDPGFDVADETEVPRLVEESLDEALRICRARAREDEDIALLFAQLGENRLRTGLAALLERRAVASSVLRRVTSAGPRDLTMAQACRGGAERIAAVLEAVPGGLSAFLASGPVHHPRYQLLAGDIRRLMRGASRGGAEGFDPAQLRGMLDRLRAHFFTKTGTPRKRAPNEFPAAAHMSEAARKAHWALAMQTAPAVAEAIGALRRDMNVILSRAVWQVFGIAAERYRRTLEARGVLDFSELLIRAQKLLGNMDEFARSRYLLEARYHHVLVDEFQDTSRAQWELVSLLVRAWGEGLGLSSEAPLPPTIFVVGDRKQSIYGFRDADVGVLDDAAAEVGALRPEGHPLRSITHSFRSVPALLRFVNDLFREIAASGEDRRDAFSYGERDAFPIEDGGGGPQEDPPLGLIAADDVRQCAAAVAAEIERLAGGAQVRDKQTGARRPIRPADIAILFRSRASHREFEEALEARRIPSYVYNGLGFFEADEVMDIVAVLRFLAEPSSDLRAAAFLRSRMVRLSDPGLQRLAPGIAEALTSRTLPPAAALLDAEDAAVLARVRSSLSDWLDLSDRIPPAELLDRVLADAAYEHEIRGSRAVSARENVKKVRSLVRRLQNSGYLTLARLADHLDRLSAGDESNAVVDAVDAVNLMTVHAAKGLEFPVVFVVNLARGSGGPRAPIRVAAHAPPEDAVAVGDFEAEFDEDQSAREREETKRLMYVALTRARDRLYLASATEGGVFRPRKGSLGEVLPESARATFGVACAAIGQDGAEVTWRAGTGATHAFRVCASTAATAPTQPAPFSAAPGGQHGQPAMPADDFGAVVDRESRERGPMTRAAAAAPRRKRAESAGAEADPGVVLGRVVHRLFQSEVRGDLPVDDLAAFARALVTADEAWTVTDLEGLAAHAARVFAGMWSQPALRSVLDGAECHYEVPLSVVPAAGKEGGSPRVLRGVIDCLACRPDGRIVVVDFKTGARREADRRQLRAYLDAVRAMYPGSGVEGCLVYPEGGS